MVASRVILFLCTGNYYRSRFAEAYFNAIARRTGSDWRADSRGLALEFGGGNVGPMAPAAVAEMTRLCGHSADLLRYPVSLDEADLLGAYRVIAVNEVEHRPLLATRFSGWEDRVAYWMIGDVHESPPEAALALLVREVDEFFSQLVSSLPRNHSGEGRYSL